MTDRSRYLVAAVLLLLILAGWAVVDVRHGDRGGHADVPREGRDAGAGDAIRSGPYGILRPRAATGSTCP